MPSPPSLPVVVCLAGAIALAACHRAAESPTATAPAPPAAAGGGHAFVPAISAADFSEHVRTLASDAFEGRAPGTPGEDKTVEYLRAQFQRLGLEPGNGDSYFQDVPMTVTTADTNAVLAIEVAGKPQALRYGTDMVIGTRTGQAQVELKDSELVFVGYGVDAPERKWNDYAGIDVRGKTVVMLVNDPGFHAGDESLFDGRRMTYYGRWTYKFDEAARKGAAAALLIHDTEGASYGWDVVRNSWSGEQFDLRATDDPAPRLPLQGWITSQAATALFTGAGLDLDAMRKAANQRGFKPVPMRAKASLALNSSVAAKSSRNVMALLPGSGQADEAIVYMGHWDHLGKRDGGGSPDASADTTYNGAVDNGTGLAGILEIAEQFSQSAKPKRSILFLAVTLEESGLLGSKYYVAHPAVPMARTVAVINLDAMPVFGKSRDMVVTGFGNSELEDLLKEIAGKQGRVLHGEAAPEAGYYFRSDHFNFATAGVPALYAKGGEDLLEGGAAAGRKAAEDYTANRYHKPADQFDPRWQLDGVMQDLEALYGVGLALAQSGQWPNWYRGNPFHATREASLKAAAKP